MTNATIARTAPAVSALVIARADLAAAKLAAATAAGRDMTAWQAARARVSELAAVVEAIEAAEAKQAAAARIARTRSQISGSGILSHNAAN